MKTDKFLSSTIVLCLLIGLDWALEVCIDENCKNGARCHFLDGKNRCQCAFGYKGKYCEVKSNFCHTNPCQNGAPCIESEGDYKCQCLNGWYGKNCEINYDDCLLQPCKNGGVCKDLLNHKYECQCVANYVGMHCEYTDPCSDPNICKMNGVCVLESNGSYKCHCHKGFKGKFCDIDIDECVDYSTGLCENGGKCVNTNGSYRCECAKGYNGERCANDIVDCKNGTCQNGGTCLDKIGHFKCVCAEGYRGTNCEDVITICETRPCKNKGQCRGYGTDYFCICEAPWTGKSCDIRNDPCVENPCVNDGTCSLVDKDIFKCTCKPGYTGRLCDQNINECSRVNCQNGGSCEDLINSWRCKCPLGYTGQLCEINTDECASKPCRNNAPCEDLVNGYRCHCPSGLTGKNCEINVDDCAKHQCLNGARCEDRVGGYTCYCLPGFIGLNCESKSDVCAQLLPCKNGGICRNEPTASLGYVCQCSNSVNTKDCSNEITKCVRLICENGGKCIEDEGKEKCICSPGFSGNRCETDINECRSNPCQHGGICQDLMNNYLCHCPSGYKGKNCQININECANNPCSPHGICIDEINVYRCECFLPYYGPTCSSKYDPCKSNNCANDAICVPNNDYKSYHCNCSTAFGRFAGTHCNEDINECFLNQTELLLHNLVKPGGHGLVETICHNRGSCINTRGSFICKCDSGFEGHQCETNINDCEQSPCKNGARCDDLVNGYRCHCETGYFGENCETEIDECQRKPCQNGAKCMDHVADYQCICMTGFSGKNCEINDNDCSVQSCSGHGSCLDKINDFECRCFIGYRGKYCEHLERPCDSNRCLNNGSCVNRNTKSNEPGYICNCRRGFSGPSCEIGMDWCRGAPCGDHGICIDDHNSYHCKCSDGYLGERCEIMKNDTCQTFAQKNLSNQSQICMHSGFCFDQQDIGGFKCSCPSGYRGTFCEENIDDCANQPCRNGGECEDGVGMYYCKCATGFQGVNCQVNGNDCSSEPCNKGKCVDQINNFTCICPRGTSGRFCDVIKDNCKDVICYNGGLCQNLLGDFDCQCKVGFTGKFCEVDVNECKYTPSGGLIDLKQKPYGMCSPTGTVSCLDRKGDFQCLCRSGYKGRFCQTRVDTCEELHKIGQSPCFNSGKCINQFHRHNSSRPAYRCVCPAGYGGDRCQVFNRRCQLNVCQNGGLCRPWHSGQKMSFLCNCPPGVGGLFCEKDYVNECEITSCYNGGRCVDGFGRATCKCSHGFCGKKCEINDPNVCNNFADEPVMSYDEESSLCHRHQCSTKVNNKRCDLECDNLACQFDGGECLHNVPKTDGGGSGEFVSLASPWSNCSVIQSKNIPCHHWFMNNRCDPQCNTESCLFDGWDCHKTIGECGNKEFCDSHYGDNHCQSECNTLECDFDGGDCDGSQRSKISGAIVLILPVSKTVFLSRWETKLLQSLTHLLHSVVRVKTLDSGSPMIYEVKVFVQESSQEDKVVRRKRSVLVEDKRGKDGTKVYLEVDNRPCKSTNNMCFENSRSAAEFVSAALRSRFYRPPIPILSVQAERRRGPQIKVPRDILIYVILCMTCLIILGILVGVLYGFIQNKTKTDHPKTKRAETWFPDGMKRHNQSASNCNHRRLSNSSRKRSQNIFSGLYANAELGNMPQMIKSKTSATDSIDDSGSNSLTSTRVTSYDANANENNNDHKNTSENSTLLSNGDINCNILPEKRLKLHMDSNKCTSGQSQLETWCFNAFVHLLVSGNGLGDLTSCDSRDKQVIMEKLFHIANNQSSAENPNMFTDVPNKKELTNSSLATILTSRLLHSGETLLHLAAKFNRKEGARFLIESGSDPNKEESNGRSCFLTAIDAGALEVATYLLEQQVSPIDIHQKGPAGVTCLIQAVKGAHLELIHTILQHTQPEECDLNVTDNGGRTALHWASATNQIGVVQLLLSYGLNRDAQDNEEMTPLYLACREGCFDVCKLLIANGANLDMSDHLDRSPRDIATVNNFEDIVALLDDYVHLTKENQQHRPVVWGQYSYYSNNYYCPSHPMDLKSVLYSSPHSLNQMACCVFPNQAHSEHHNSLATVTHSSHPCHRQSSANFKRHTSELHKELKSPNFYKEPGAYFDYSVAAPNVQMISYPKIANPTSSTSVPGITPSPDSDSPGHWSTSSPSLSPRSKNQQQQQQQQLTNQRQSQRMMPVHQPMKSSVLHYHPTNHTMDSNQQNNELYSFHSRNNVCQY